MTLHSHILLVANSLFLFSKMHIFCVDLHTFFLVTFCILVSKMCWLLNTRFYELPCFTICIFNKPYQSSCWIFNSIFNCFFEYAHEVLTVDRININFFDINMRSSLSLQKFVYHLFVGIIFFRISTTDITYIVILNFICFLPVIFPSIVQMYIGIVHLVDAGEFRISHLKIPCKMFLMLSSVSTPLMWCI